MTGLNADDKCVADLEKNQVVAKLSGKENEEDESHKASDCPALVMVDESTGHKYTSMVPCKGFGEMERLSGVSTI